MRVFRAQWKMYAVFSMTLILVSAVTVFHLRNQRGTEEIAHMTTLAQASAQAVEDRLVNTDRILSEVIQKGLDGGKNQDWRGVSDYLKTLAKVGPGIDLLLVLSSTGEVLASNRAELVGKNFAHRHYFLKALQASSSDMRVVSPSFTTVLGQYTFTLSRKIGSERDGVVMATMDVPFLSQMIEKGLYASDVHTTLTHGDGTRILTSHKANERGKDSIDEQNALTASFFPLKSDTSPGFEHLTSLGGRTLAIQGLINPPGLNLDAPLRITVTRDATAVYGNWLWSAWVFLGSAICTVAGAALALSWYQRRQRYYVENLYLKEALVNISVDGIHVINQEGILIDANPAFLCMLDLDSSAIGKTNVWDYEVFRSAEAIQTSIADCLKSKGVAKFEATYKVNTGREIEVEVRYISFSLHDQQLLFASCRDISQQKRTECELQKLYLAVKQSPEGICITNSNGIIEYVNPAFCSTSGYAEEELVGQNPSILSSGIHPRSIYEDLWNEIKQGHVWKGELTNRRKDGTHYIESEIISPIRQRNGEVSHFLAIKSDITDKKRIELELARYRSHLEQLVSEKTRELTKANESLVAANALANDASKVKAQFLSNMSHELRTPLNGILGMLFLMRREHPNDLISPYLKKIELSAKHLLNVISDILDLSKIDAGKLSLDLQPIDIRQIVADVCSIVSTAAADKGIEIDVQNEDMPWRFIGDPTRITQALINYVANAIKFSESGTVRIKTSIDVDEGCLAVLRFEVLDDGPGISNEILNSLFSPFQQGDSSTTRVYGGTGLGLAITRSIAIAMGGNAGGRSEIGVGSCFWFTIRLEKDLLARNSTSLTNPDEALLHLQQHYRGQKVLLVEDEPINQEVSAIVLKEAGFEVSIASNGREAVELVDRQGFSLVLMDMQMPIMDGMQATRSIRSNRRFAALPIIAFTANAFQEEKQLCLDAGMNDFLSKPVDPQKLFAILLKWLPKNDVEAKFHTVDALPPT